MSNPLSVAALSIPLKLAMGTSSAAIFITAAFSVVGYVLNGMGRAGLPPWSLGFVDLQRGTALAIGSLLMARAGAHVSFRTHPSSDPLLSLAGTQGNVGWVPRPLVRTHIVLIDFFKQN